MTVSRGGLLGSVWEYSGQGSFETFQSLRFFFSKFHENCDTILLTRCARILYCTHVIKCYYLINLITKVIGYIVKNLKGYIVDI